MSLNNSENTIYDRAYPEPRTPSISLLSSSSIPSVSPTTSPSMVTNLVTIKADPIKTEMNGSKWCNVCQIWHKLHSLQRHLNGKQHKKNIEIFAFKNIWQNWRKIRATVSVNVIPNNLTELSIDKNLWYSQICLSCLCEVPYTAWDKHSAGKRHQNIFAKSPATVTLKRKIAPGNEGCCDIPQIMAETYFRKLSHYEPEKKILIIGEQDFSYSVAICTILQSGQNVVGTSYLGPFDASSNEPEIHPSDGETRSKYFRTTLPAQNGTLQKHLNLLTEYGAKTAYNIDATKLYQCLVSAKPQIYDGPFDIIIFPFPRSSLKRGTNFRNSVLIQGFFNEIRMQQNKLLNGMVSQIQIILLQNQFKEWDVLNIAKENGWKLEEMCYVNFKAIPQYQPREVSGKEWNPKRAILFIFKLDKEFDTNIEQQLVALNETNDVALLPSK